MAVSAAKALSPHGLPVTHDYKSQELRYSWYVVVVLMICYTFSFIDRQILSLLVGPIKHDLMISDTRVGLLQGLAFATFYTLLGLPIGWLADKYSRRTIIASGVFLWSLMTALCSIARNFWSLFGIRVGVGVGEATLGPAALSLISDYFPRDRLSTALSVYSMGIFVGSGLANILGGAVVGAVSHLTTIDVPLVGAIAPWRLVFLIVGLPGLAVALLVYTVREPIRRHLLANHDGQATRLGVKAIAAQIFKRWHSVAGLAFAMSCQSMASYALGFWTPAFFERVYHWPRGRAGLVLGLITISFGCLGMYVGGRLSDRWLRQGTSDAAIKVALIAAIGAGASIVLAMTGSTANITIALLVPSFFFIGLPTGSAYAAMQLIFPNQLRGTVSAVFLFIINLVGLSLGPLLPALFTDYLFMNEKMVGHSVALTAAVASLFSIALLLLTR